MLLACNLESIRGVAATQNRMKMSDLETGRQSRPERPPFLKCLATDSALLAGSVQLERNY